MRAASILLLAILAASAFAQDETDYEENESEVLFVDATSDVNVRRDPSKDAARVAILRLGERAELIGTAYGWKRVRTKSGKKGWVDRRFLGDPVPGEAEQTSEFVPPPCPKKFEDCPEFGCVKNQAEELRHQFKRNASRTGPITPLPLSAFRTLQKKAMDAVGEAAHLLADDRARLSKLAVAGKRVSEGSRVRVTGYVVGEPRPNKGESVNCGVTGEAGNDYHVPIASEPSTGNHKRDEYRSIVVEMIPQERPAGWTDEKLKEIRDLKRMVKVEGRLFYDDLHRVNANPDKPVGAQPRRFSLWEIHPVTEVWVCAKRRCDAADSSQWTKLSEWSSEP